MSGLSSWWNALGDFLNHPIDSISALSMPSPAVSGFADVGVLTSVYGAPDTITSAAVRANGVDPITGNIIAPQYLATAEGNGYSLSDPGAFIKKVSQDAQNFYDQQYAKNLADTGGGFNPGSPSSMLIFLVVAVLAFFLFKAVK
jgi:hypothetical protein